MEPIFFLAVGTGIGVIAGSATVLAIKFLRDRRDAKEIERLLQPFAPKRDIDDPKIIVINRNRPTK